MKNLYLILGAGLIAASSAIWAEGSLGGYTRDLGTPTGDGSITSGTGTVEPIGGTELIGPPILDDGNTVTNDPRLIGPPINMDEGNLGIYNRDIGVIQNHEITTGSGTVGVIGGTELVGPPIAIDGSTVPGDTRLIGPPIMDGNSLGIYHRDDPVTIDARDLDLPNDLISTSVR